MLALPTTTVSVLRGTTTDDYGDELDTDTVVASGIPASVLEQSRTVFDQATSTPMVVHTITGRVTRGTDIRLGDRLRDENTGQVYMVQNVNPQDNPLIQIDVRLELKRAD